MSKIYSIAHRGGLAYAPENTLAAIKNAIKIGADYVEIDVHLSKDGEVVVIHDDTLDRTTDGTGLVREKTMKDLMRLDVGRWFSYEFEGEKVPTLGEVFDLAKDKIGVVIEIKNGPYFYENIEKKILDIAEEKGMLSKIIVISFDHEAIKRVKAIDPLVKTGLLYFANIVDMEHLADETGARFMCPCWKMVTPDTVRRAKEAGLKINIWTLDEPQLIRKFLEMGVDCISSNMPDVLLNEIEKFQSEQVSS